MNSFYGDHSLARMIANERISHREGITLSLGVHPLKDLANSIRTFINTILEQVEQPLLIPTYCTEYSPAC